MIVEGGHLKCYWVNQLGKVLFAWLTETTKEIIRPGTISIIAAVASFILVGQFPTIAQNCDLDFPGISNQVYSSACGGISNSVNLGKSIFMDDNDVFTFDAPSLINIQGNFTVSAQGNGRIVIPAGVTVIVDGNMQLSAKNGGCDESNPCVFTIVVNGSLQINGSLQNNLVSLVWEGTGTVPVTDKLENTGNVCRNCGVTCPQFPAGPGGCVDSGDACSINFCTSIYGTDCQTDSIDPVIVGCPLDQAVSTNSGSCEAIVNWTVPQATDNCGISSFSSSHNPGDLFPVGITTVTYTATDNNGLTTECSFQVEVIDNEVPVIAGCPGDIIVATPDCNQVAVNWSVPVATDNCTLSSFSSNHQPGDNFPLGATSITYTAVDQNGNSAICTFTILVEDQQAPQFTGCPSDIIATEIDPLDNSATVSWQEPGAVDNCAVISLTSTHQPGTKFSEGQTVVTYTAADAAGNIQTCSFMVVVQQDEATIKDQLKVFKAFTPNGDGINDLWIIEGLEQFPENSVTVFDRWGNNIFQANGYNNEQVVWGGTANNSRISSGKLVPAGTYFYSIIIPGMESLSGYVELVK